MTFLGVCTMKVSAEWSNTNARTVVAKFIVIICCVYLMCVPFKIFCGTYSKYSYKSERAMMND